MAENHAKIENIFSSFSLMLGQMYGIGKLPYNVSFTILGFDKRYKELLTSKDIELYPKNDPLPNINNQNVQKMSLMDLLVLFKALIREAHKNGGINLEVGAQLGRNEKVVEMFLREK